ncbi:MAG: ADP-ribosylglycohydrolase family protein [Gammaproteobacteria bacterium]|nr:MAG: ADP-ribosylglycohydrolase family protein [Gammaproteobacteria bacterium]
MLGAITGDIIGSIYEGTNFKSREFPLFGPGCHFTDDTVLTVALADAILNEEDYGQVMKRYFARYPYAGYGGSFQRWASSPDSEPYNSWGDGSAMRTSAVGYTFDTLNEVLEKAEHYASFTHNHPEGIKGAQATSTAIFLARIGESKAEIRSYITDRFHYDMTKTIDEIRPDYSFDVSCQGTVPQAITAFLESLDYEDAIRNAISIGGDSDTIACITGGIAEAYYGGLPDDIAETAMNLLNKDLRTIVTRFYAAYIN